MRCKYPLFHQACDMKTISITILFWLLSILLLSDESQTSKIVSFYNQGDENIFKGTLCVNLVKYSKAVKERKKSSSYQNELFSELCILKTWDL